MRRKTAYAGFSYLAGVFFASFLTYELMLLCCGILLIFISVFIAVNIKNKNYIILCLTSALIGIGIYTAYYKLDYEKTVSYADSVVEFEGEITDYKYVPSDLMLVTAKGKLNGWKKATVTMFVPYEDCDYYDKIYFVGKFSKITNTLSFDSESYNRPKGIYLHGSSAKEVEISAGSFNPLKYIRRYSDYLYERITDILPGEEGTFIGAMLCGDKSGIDSEMKTGLYRMGIGHIFSVSGTHLVIVTYLVSSLLKLVNLSKKRRFFVTETVIIGFAVFAGMTASVTRAAIMMTVINLSSAAKRYPDSLTSLGISGILLTIFTPYQVRSASFLLSMAGAFALGTAAPAVTRAMKLKCRFRKLIENFIAMCVIWVCSLPFCLMFFNEVSVVSPIMNVIFIPLCSFALVLTVITAFFGGASIIAHPLLKLAGLAVRPVLKTADIAGKLWFTYIPLGFRFLKIIIIASVIIMIITAVIKKKVSSVVRCTVVTATLCILMSFAYMMLNSRNAEIYVISYDNSVALVLNKDRKAVIIETDGDTSDACVRLLESKGIVSVEKLFAGDNMESLKADYYHSLDFCNFDYNNSLYIDEVDSFSFGECEVSFENYGITVKYGETSTLVKLNDMPYSHEFNLIVDAVSEEKTAYTSYETVSFADGSDPDGIAVITLSPDKNPKVRRYDHAFN